jgi:hypothetical protein
LKQGLHVEAEADQARPWRQRRRVGGAGGAVQRHQRPVERGGDVHQAGVVAHHQPRAGEQVDGLAEVGASAQVAAGAAGQPFDLGADGRILGRADSQTGKSVCARRRASSAKWRAGQRLAGPYSAPGQKATGAGAASRPSAARVARTLSGFDCEMRRGERRRRRSADVLGEQGVALGQLRQRRFVERMDAVEQQAARLAAEADALGMPAKKGSRADFQEFGRTIAAS